MPAPGPGCRAWSLAMPRLLRRRSSALSRFCGRACCAASQRISASTGAASSSGDMRCSAFIPRRPQPSWERSVLDGHCILYLPGDQRIVDVTVEQFRESAAQDGAACRQDCGSAAPWATRNRWKPPGRGTAPDPPGKPAMFPPRPTNPQLVLQHSWRGRPDPPSTAQPDSCRRELSQPWGRGRAPGHSRGGA
jgi:hypothetical protein